MAVISEHFNRNPLFSFLSSSTFSNSSISTLSLGSNTPALRQPSGSDGLRRLSLGSNTPALRQPSGSGSVRLSLGSTTPSLRQPSFTTASSSTAQTAQSVEIKMIPVNKRSRSMDSPPDEDKESKRQR